MPYINNETRKKYEDSLVSLPPISTAGDLNYIITRLCHYYVVMQGQCYQSYNDVMGALEGCKLELYRRQISNYEDKKIKENGDV